MKQIYISRSHILTHDPTRTYSIDHTNTVNLPVAQSVVLGLYYFDGLADVRPLGHWISKENYKWANPITIILLS